MRNCKKRRLEQLNTIMRLVYDGERVFVNQLESRIFWSNKQPHFEPRGQNVLWIFALLGAYKTLECKHKVPNWDPQAVAEFTSNSL